MAVASWNSCSEARTVNPPHDANEGSQSEGFKDAKKRGSKH